MSDIRIEKEQAIATAAAFPMDDVVERYARDHQISTTVAAEHARELLRDLVLCAISPAVKYGMRGPVDDIWHTFIMFTSDYMEFCKRVAGRYIHHKPETRKRVSDRDAYRATLRDYRATFGEEPPPHIWPAADVTALDCSGSCNTCGGGDPGCSGGCSGCDTCGTDCDSGGVGE